MNIVDGGLLLLEWPRACALDDNSGAGLKRLLRVAEAEGIEVLLAPSEGATTGVVCLLRRSAISNGGSFERRERKVPVERLVESAFDLLRCAGRDALRDNVAADRVDLLLVEAAVEHDAPPRPSSRGDLAGVRVWHVVVPPDHRLASTAVVLPEGTIWADPDEAALAAIIARTGPADPVVERYRGCMTIDDEGARALDRLALREMGWSWLSHRRSARRKNDSVVELGGVSDSGDVVLWRGYLTPIVPDDSIAGGSAPEPAAMQGACSWRVDVFERIVVAPGAA